MPKNRGAADWQIGSSNATFRVQSLFDVSNRVVLITGGGSGIGSMIAAGFVANGARVYIASRNDCSELAEELSTRGPGACHALVLDVAKEESISACIDELTAREPDGVGVLVNNAGTNWAEPIETYSQKGWDKVYNVNVRGVFMMIQVRYVCNGRHCCIVWCAVRACMAVDGALTLSVIWQLDFRTAGHAAALGSRELGRG